MDQLVVAHYHLRPGGVRRVIETALPPIASGGRLRRVVLATGETPDAAWLRRLRASLGGTPLEVRIHPEFLYWSELHADSSDLTRKLGAICNQLLADCGGSDCILWAHNLGLGRNLPLSSAWAQAARATGATMVSHHHDFFFDNRWNRWPEMRASGTHALSEAAAAVFPAGERIVHVVINRADHRCLAQGFAGRAVWIPNAVTPARHSADEEKSVPGWLARRTGFQAPYWLLPCRLLRRKNLAESVLLARWLRPQARVVTTGAPTSPEERRYAERLREAAARHGWGLDLSILAGVENHPPVSALIANAEVVLLTSLMEGFGLPYLEAAEGRRPLLARSLPNVIPDLVSMGLRAPLAYDEVFVPADLFDAKKESARQLALWNEWRSLLPDAARALCEEPVFLQKPGEAAAFSRLSFSAQEEVLSRSSADLHAALSPWNPGLAAIRGSAGDLPATILEGEGELTPERFAENFQSALEAARAPEVGPPDASGLALQAFLRDRLASSNLYPLLFTTSP
jgi:glycosyltransferase involved in cell wall biosynthesis